MIAAVTVLVLSAVFARAISKATGDRARWTLPVAPPRYAYNPEGAKQ